MIRLSRLLCPVDLSAASRRALEYAGLMARWYSSTVTVLHVLPIIHTPAEYAVVPNAPLMTPEERERTEARVSSLAADALPGVKHDVRIEEGFVAEQIASVAGRMSARMIVMGSHGRTGIDRLTVGSVTEKVLRRSEIPVFVVPPHADPAPTAPGPFTSIVCAVDFSGPSLTAIEYARSLAREAGSPLTLVHVLDWPGDHDPVELLSPVLSEYRRRREGEAAARLKALSAKAAQGGLMVSSLVAQGKPYREIARLAGDVVADLIVMGVRSHGAVQTAVFGSTASRVVREAPCPVLTVHEEPS